jgi:hypothetical protein
MSAVTRVEFPEWRNEVVDAVRSLSDPAYQQRIWVERDFPHANFHDALDECIHVLFDDADVLPEPSHRLGVLLRNEAEVEALRPLGVLLDAIIDDLEDAAAEQYLAIRAGRRWCTRLRRRTRC